MRAALALAGAVALFSWAAPAQSNGDYPYWLGPEGTSPGLAFLIEGGAGNEETSEKGIRYARLLAIKRGGSVFDAIHSYDYEHMKAFILGKESDKPLTELEQRLFAIHASLTFSNSQTSDGRRPSAQGILNNMVHKPYERMVSEGLLKEKPEWARTLEPKTFGQLVKDTAIDMNADEMDFTIKKWRLGQRGTVVSNDVSRKAVLHYLEDHPKVDRVYAMVGEKHLPFLDTLGLVTGVDTHQHYVSGWIEVSGGRRRHVDFLVFGGMHDELESYRKLCKALSETPVE